MGTSLTYDVKLDDDGDLPERTAHISGFELIVQRVQRRLRTHLGEYVIDSNVGLPYLAWIAQKPPNVEGIGAIVRREIETTPGVLRVSDWTGSFDRDTRTLSYAGVVHTRDGDASITVLPLGAPGSGNRNASVRLAITTGRIARAP